MVLISLDRFIKAFQRRVFRKHKKALLFLFQVVLYFIFRYRIFPVKRDNARFNNKFDKRYLDKVCPFVFRYHTRDFVAINRRHSLCINSF